jgi:hypothetical protein
MHSATPMQIKAMSSGSPIIIKKWNNENAPINHLVYLAMQLRE